MSLEDVVEKEFDERFSQEDMRLLKNQGICPKVANSYAAEFCAKAIMAFVQQNCSAATASMYFSETFSTEGELCELSALLAIRQVLQKRRLTSLESYDMRFSKDEIDILLVEGVPTNFANKLNKLNATEICRAYLNGGFDKRFDQLKRFHRSYDTWGWDYWYYWDYVHCYDNNPFLSATRKVGHFFKAIMYVARDLCSGIAKVSDVFDIIGAKLPIADFEWDWERGRISYTLGGPHRNHLFTNEIARIARAGCSLDDYDYFRRMNFWKQNDINLLLGAGIRGKELRGYYHVPVLAEFGRGYCGRRVDYFNDLNGEEYKYIVRAGDYREANYGQKVELYKVEQLLKIWEMKITYEQVREYDACFSLEQIFEFIQEGKSALEVNEFNKTEFRFRGKAVCELVKLGVSSEEANSYSDKYSDAGILGLIRSGLGANIANEYADALEEPVIADGIIELFEVGCTPERVLTYGRRFSAFAVNILWKIGLKPDDPTIKLNDEVVKLFGEITDLDQISKSPENYLLLGTGSKSIVLLNKENKSAWKFSRDVSNEFNLLKKLEEVHQGNLNCVVRAIGQPKEGVAIELEYLDGETLESKLKREGRLDDVKMVNCFYDILYGIYELRWAGIYHRDLHDRNILIRHANDRAMIIDLGEATDDPAEIYELNRAYGGNNDLISLGQLIYKMFTGHNLFNEGIGFTGEVKDEIKLKRERVYADPEKLKQLLEHIRIEADKSSINGFLTGCIIELLNDNLWVQPHISKVKEMIDSLEFYARSSFGP